MKDEIIEGLRKLTPPEGNDDADEVRSWRWRVAIVTGTTAASLVCYIALAGGFFSSVFPGYALASDVQALQRQWRESRENDLGSKILDTRMRQCISNNGVRTLYTQSLQKMLIEYQKLTSRSYPLPDCEDFHEA